MLSMQPPRAISSSSSSRDAQVLWQLSLDAHHLRRVVEVLRGLRQQRDAIARRLAALVASVVVGEDVSAVESGKRPYTSGMNLLKRPRALSMMRFA